ncbi:MAG TPA: hypothetical protein VFR47_01195, partial [Anaerolineales bacterium]|nr:hypothetical protein [Anaerolineales bacterium]
GRTLSGMQPRPSFDRALLIPIAIGLVSILGIGWIFLTSDLRETLIPPTAVPTAIPFDGSSLDTEIAPLYPTQDETPPTATATSPVAYPGPLAETLPSTSTLITESLPTPTPNRFQPLPAGNYDDMDPNIAYDPYWTVLKNPGTANAYKGTLHVSAGIGNEASFRFTGERFRLGYQRGTNFGTVTVLIDDQPYGFHEQAFDLLWRSPQLSPGNHFVRIIHESGESINLDYIEILDES